MSVTYAQVRERWTRTLPIIRPGYQYWMMLKITSCVPRLNFIEGEQNFSIPYLGIGPTGNGKTEGTNEWARMCHRGTTQADNFIRLSLPREGMSIFGTIPIPGDELARDAAGQIRFDAETGEPLFTGDKVLTEASSQRYKDLWRRLVKESAVILMDDASSAVPPEVRTTAMLDFSQTKRMGSIQWRGGDQIILMANPPEYAPNTVDWQPADLGRMFACWMDVGTSREYNTFESNAFARVFGKAGAYKQAKFDLTAGRQKAVEAVRDLLPRIQGRVVAYLERHPSAVAGEVPRVNQLAPEFRKFHLATYALATAMSQGHAKFAQNDLIEFIEDEEGFSPAVKVLEGLLGKPTANEWIGFLPMISFPSVRDVLDGKEEFEFNPERPDHAMAFFGELESVVSLDGPERAKQAADFMLAQPNSAADMIMPTLAYLTKGQSPLDYNTMKPVLSKLGKIRSKTAAGIPTIK